MSNNTKQPKAVQNGSLCIWDLVKADLTERVEFGEVKHGTRLQPFNGRDALIDAYQEAMDLAMYLRQVIYERDGK